jgi:hypothetical protein
MAKHAPGSFTKNFAWHGTGLRKLHAVIRAGFHDTLAPVSRDRFRKDSGLDASLSLIPINFFLHNRADRMSVDELVFQAIERPHSIRFDRLALFALHLNRVGSGRRVVSRPAMWANEFVRERLWQAGVWRSSALPDASLDPFIEDRMDAQLDARVKCRNNYRHLYELCQFWPTRLPVINSQAEQWIASALFLAWDRHILDGGAADKPTLIAMIDSDELYKLLGVTRAYALAQAGDLADLYNSVGRLDRFREAKKVPAPATPPLPKPAPEIPEEEGLEWLEQEESDEAVERRAVERQEQKRNRKKAAALKQHYKNICQFCGARLQVAEDRYYSEAAHIKSLGAPHNGPDKASNMLVLCPNHHLQFDRGVLRLRKEGGDYVIRSKTLGDPLNGRKITIFHSLDDSCVRYHYDWFGSTRS